MAMRLGIRTAGVDDNPITAVAARRGTAVRAFAGAGVACDAIGCQARRRGAANTLTNDAAGAGCVGVTRVVRRDDGRVAGGTGVGIGGNASLIASRRAGGPTSRNRVPLAEITHLRPGQ